jgi:hypothetical protein
MRWRSRVKVGAAEHLPFDHFRFAVDAFRSPVAVRERERGGSGLDVEVEVEVEVEGEGVLAGGPAARASAIHRRSSSSLAGSRSSMAAKEPIRLPRAFISVQAEEIRATVSGLCWSRIGLPV